MDLLYMLMFGAAAGFTGSDVVSQSALIFHPEGTVKELEAAKARLMVSIPAFVLSVVLFIRFVIRYQVEQGW